MTETAIPENLGHVLPPRPDALKTEGVATRPRYYRHTPGTRVKEARFLCTKCIQNLLNLLNPRNPAWQARGSAKKKPAQTGARWTESIRYGHCGRTTGADSVTR